MSLINHIHSSISIISNMTIEVLQYHKGEVLSHIHKDNSNRSRCLPIPLEIYFLYTGKKLELLQPGPGEYPHNLLKACLQWELRYKRAITPDLEDIEGVYMVCGCKTKYICSHTQILFTKWQPMFPESPSHVMTAIAPHQQDCSMLPFWHTKTPHTQALFHGGSQ